MLNICNYYERLVIDHLWHLQAEAAEPYSQTFLEDVACLALNQLPICYVRSMVDKSVNTSDFDLERMRIATNRAIEQAMDQVRRRPHEARDIEYLKP